MSKFGDHKARLRTGRVYRRSDLLRWSKSPDRHIRALLREGMLRRLGKGLYYCPKQSAFGEVPPGERDLVRAFLKDDRFLLTSPNAYNLLEVGTTQLYNVRVVYNYKRRGEVVLGGQRFLFRVKRRFPRRSVSQEFLLVDLVNNVHLLAEDRETVLRKVRKKALSLNRTRLKHAVREFALPATKKFWYETVTPDAGKLFTKGP